MKPTDDKEIDVVNACGCCEYSIVMELTGTVLCKRKGRIKKVHDTDSCRHFTLDLLKLDPIPRRKYLPEL